MLRLVNCEYDALGCSWQGPFHEMALHEKECSAPSKKGEEVLEVVKQKESKHKEEVKNYRNILGLLSYEKITFNDIQLRPYRTDDFSTKLYYESGRFTAFSQQWLIKTAVNDHERHPSHTIERRMTFQLVLKSRVTTPMDVHYLVINGPNSDVKINPQVYRFEFTEEKTESPYETLPLVDSAECNKILANKTINLRLILFQVPK